MFSRNMAILWSLGASLTLSTHCISQEQTPTLDQILRAWSERRQKVRAATFTWTTRQTMTQGSLLKRAFALAHGISIDGGNSFPHDVPSRDVTLTYKCSWTFQDNMVVFKTEEPQWSYKFEGFVPRTSICVLNGTLDKEYLRPEEGNDDHQRGVVRKQVSARLTWVEVTPLQMLYLIDSDGLRRVSPAISTGLFDGKPCLLMERRLSGVQSKEIWWIDRLREFLPLRVTAFYAETNTPQVQITFQYQNDKQHGWLPMAWKGVWSYPDGKLKRSSEATVTRYEINDLIDPKRFEFEFPAGTQVYDHTTQTEYIVRSDQSKRIIDKSEYGPDTTYQKLVDTDPRKQGGWHGVVIAISAVVVLLIAGFFARRWLRGPG